MKTLTTIKIDKTNADNADVKHLYETAFPKEEKIPYAIIIKLLDRMPLDFTAYYDGDTFVGLTMILNRYDFNWLWYFAVSKELRSKGYGHQILTMLKSNYSNRPIILDMESPDQIADNMEQRHRRHAFYLRNGFRDTYVGKTFRRVDYTILIYGEGTFTMNDYDTILKDLSRYWKEGR
ncbi:MAG TPA: GNAT family N-acetyltransferase [Paludibacteraceae bacterium]|nr:GNAT family N-acetyltransferase [Paludibacteraceae bacterium]HPH63127.1 GNAT family N-acetyltransferase [Paludibacteraceae bacterium]